MASNAAAASVSSTERSSTANSNTASSNGAPNPSSLIGIPRSSLDFFSLAAPALHSYVRSLQNENTSLRHQNEMLRNEAEILDGVSDFLREMSKSEMNYAQFMAAKTREVEEAKQRQNSAAGSAMSAPKDLPPVKPKAASPFAAAVTPAVPLSAMKPAAAASIKPAAAASQTPASVVVNSPQHAAALAARPKKSQKRPPNAQAGDGAKFVFTPADPSTRTPALRHVVPYPHEYRVFVKQRWIGRRILDVLVSDFAAPTGAQDEAASEDADEAEEEVDTNEASASSAESSSTDERAHAYYRAAMSSGHIKVNDHLVTEEYILRSGDHVTHATHRHEPPVLDSDPARHQIEIISETEDLLVVNKPCGLPVHESGKLRHNSLLGLLRNQSPYTQQTFFPVHRLDKVTSGVVLLGKTKDAAARVGRAMKFTDVADGSKTGKEAVKIYLARVNGHFPSALPATSSTAGDQLTSVPATSSADDSSAAASWLRLDAPIRTVSLRKGVHEVLSSSIDPASYGSATKSAVTLFRLRSYDARSDTSVIECRPLTGRTHQIRLHLQHIGHPIMNDPIYGPGACEGNTYGIETSLKEKVGVHPGVEVQQKQPGAWIDGCAECENQMYYSTPKQSAADEQPLRYTTGIFLHALSYSIPLATANGSNTSSSPAMHEYRTIAPEWASPGFDVQAAMGKRVRTTKRAAETMGLAAANTARGDSSSFSSISSVGSSSSSPSPPRYTFSLRPSLPSDLPAITSIYHHWVLHGTGTFEEVPPGDEEMGRRRKDVLERGLPWLVATTKDRPDPSKEKDSDVPPLLQDSKGDYIVGYAYLSPFRVRTAYRYSVEDSLYAHPHYVARTGLGETMLKELMRISERCGFTQMLAVIGDSANVPSIGLHLKNGFTHAGVMRAVGFKHGRWLDVVILQKALNAGATQLPTIPAPVPFQPESMSDNSQQAVRRRGSGAGSC